MKMKNIVNSNNLLENTNENQNQNKISHQNNIQIGNLRTSHSGNVIVTGNTGFIILYLSLSFHINFYFHHN